MERYEFSEGGSDKFWEVAVDGETLTVRYGRIGTQGQRKDKTFASAEAAEKEKARLIKEKTGKGYTRPATAESGAAAAPASIQSSAPATKTAAASAKPTVAAADAAAPTAVSRVEPPAKSTTESTADDPSPPTRQTVVAEDPPADEPRLVHGTALPTRMRRGAPPEKSPAEAWAAVRDMVRRDLERMQGGAPFPNQDALAAMLETPLAGLPAEQAARWFRVLADTFAPLMGYRHRDGYPAYNALVYDFAHALVDAHGAEYALRLVKLIDNNPHRRAYLEHPWGMAAWPALRAAVVRAPDADYRAALDWALAASARERDAKWHAIWSFLLADDRPEEHHALQFLPLLQAAVAQGIDVGDDVCFVPLLAECPGGADPRWFKKKDYFFYFTYSWVDTADIAATVHAAAAAQGVSPVRVLMWLLDYATEDDRTRLACALLDSREPEALSLLLPKSYDKWIRAGLEQAMDACPRWLFRQLLASYHPGRSEPTVKTRLTKLCQRFDVATLTGWIADLGERGQQTLDKLLATDARFATAEELPSVLRTPPWRKARGKTHADLVIPLQAIPTPFVFEMSDERRAALVESSRQQVWKAVREITTVASVLATVTEAERSIARQKDRPIPEFETPLPNRGVDESELANWVARRATQLLEADIVDGYRHPYHRLIHALPVLPDVIALRLWEQTGLIRSGNCNWWIDEQALLARFGERALPGFLGMLGADPIAGLTALQAVDAHDIAPFAARAFVQLKKARPLAIAWLKNHPRAAVFGLLPDAVGQPGTARNTAEFALRWLLTNVDSAKAALEDAVAAHAAQEARVADAVRQVLARDPLDQFPAKIAKLPGWLIPASLYRPRLKNGAALPDEAMIALAEMLSFCNSESLYAGIARVRADCDAESLAAFAWDLFSTWLGEGAPGKENWALRAIGWLGDDDSARRLTPLIRKWPGEAAHARAVTGLDVLADIGSDVALMHLNGIAEKLKFKGLQEKAREKIAAIAEARDLTPEELADRLAPDFDLDERGGLDLDFGPRRFRVGFDEFLKPWVKDPAGVRLKELPKPNKSDDATRAAEAVARWSALKKDARTVASLQLTRLEALLASGRRIAPAVFDTFFARHPLIRHLAQRLVWGVHAGDDALAAPRTLFRLTEDLTCADENDEPVRVDFSPDAPTAIGLVHPLHLSAEQKAAWGALFGDYEIAQPFPQLGRDTYALTEAERPLDKLSRFAGAKVESKRMRGMASRGWQLGDAQDGGCIFWVQREIALADGHRTWAVLEFGDGLLAGAADYEEDYQTLGDLSLGDDGFRWGNTVKHPFAALGPVAASELLRDLSQLTDAAKS
ncbi:MAG TPA: DUF4132 domain-containing protein [Accumulibacter sp.]|nr:DUF4132 domain-containing protein [Accumulibacter sp.]